MAVPVCTPANRAPERPFIYFPHPHGICWGTYQGFPRLCGIPGKYSFVAPVHITHVIEKCVIKRMGPLSCTDLSMKTENNG